MSNSSAFDINDLINALNNTNSNSSKTTAELTAYYIIGIAVIASCILESIKIIMNKNYQTQRVKIETDKASSLSEVQTDKK